MLSYPVDCEERIGRTLLPMLRAKTMEADELKSSCHRAWQGNKEGREFEDEGGGL